MSTNNKEAELTPEEIEIDAILEVSTQKIEQINYMMDNPQERSGPALKPSGPNFTNRSSENIEYTKKRLQYHKELTIAEAKNKTVKLLEKSSLQTQLRAYDKIDIWAEKHKEQAKTLQERTLKAKDISESQDIAMKQLSKKKGMGNSLSERYSSSLHRNKLPDKSLDKLPKIDLDKE